MPRSKDKPVVLVGIVGSTLDAAGGAADRRWGAWRPSVAMCGHGELPVARVELLHHRKFGELAARVAADIRTVSAWTEVRSWPLDVANPWEFGGVYGALYDFARGYPFAVDDEDYLVHITTGTHVEQICLFLLAEARYLPGRLLQTSPPPRTPGAAPVTDPLGHVPGRYQLIDLDLSAYDQLAARSRKEHQDALTLLKSGITTKNAAYNAMMLRLEQVASRSRAPVLLLGPTGSGKSSLARRIHALKRERRVAAGELVEVNCATLRGDAAMSTLFGHVKGAFTGAVTERPGLLRRADGGVLFLDEIGELGLDEQAMLLRALEDRRFLPMGSDKEVASDFQLVAGTNRDLRAAVATGRFRDDLLARIDLWTFHLPALRERPEDLEPNLDLELERAGRELGLRVSISREARAAYLAAGAAAPWPGNFRDLAASVTRMATLAAGGRITEADVAVELAALARQWGPARPGDPSTDVDDDTAALDALLGRERAAALDRFDRAQLAEVVAVCRASASLSEAGRALFAASRARKAAPNDADRLRKYLARFGLRFADVS
jgi:transcriptional regulatory protein RtcR